MDTHNKCFMYKIKTNMLPVQMTQDTSLEQMY
jgi:hypothetical protein